MNSDIQTANKSSEAPQETAQDERRHIGLKRTIGIVSFLIFVGLMVFVTFRIGIPLVESIFGSTEATEDGTIAFREMVAQNPVRGRLIYVGIQILQVFIALIPGEAVEIAGGVAFGAIEGMALSLFGVAIGSSIIFMLSKTLGMRFVELFVSQEKINSLKFINNNRRLNSVVFTVFLIPGTPKDVLTYVVALTRMKLPKFLLLSLIARIPSVLSSTWGGDALIKGDYWKSAVIFGVTGIVSLIGLLIYNKLSKRWNEKKESTNVQSGKENI